MINPDMIPPEAVEAAARRIALDTEGSDEWWTLYMRRATAAIAAGLAAWPGVDYRPGAKVTKTWRDPGKIILPLPQEVSDG